MWRPPKSTRFADFRESFDDGRQNNDFLEGKSNRAYCFWAFVLILILTIVVLVLFKDKPEVLIPVLTGLGGLFSGFLGGWGLGKKQK